MTTFLNISWGYRLNVLYKDLLKALKEEDVAHLAFSLIGIMADTYQTEGSDGQLTILRLIVSKTQRR